jgi:hypothetical protein
MSHRREWRSPDLGMTNRIMTASTILSARLYSNHEINSISLSGSGRDVVRADVAHVFKSHKP